MGHFQPVIVGAIMLFLQVKKWYEKYTTLDNQTAASKKETSNQE